MILTAPTKSFYAGVTSHYREIQAAIKSSQNGDSTRNIDPESILGTKGYGHITCFNIEAIIYLERWADVETFIRESATILEDDVFHAIIADIILTSDKMPTDYTVRSLQVRHAQYFF